MPHPALRELAHRPWPMPAGRWVMQQRWEELLFAHWPVEADALRALLPPGLELDTFEGQAWLGVVPFMMRGVRARWAPPLPTTHSFAELNVRIYVRHGDRPGVWFLSLDAASALAVAGARLLYHLPYFRASMRSTRRDQEIEYVSTRTHRGAARAELRASYAPCGPASPAEEHSLEHFLCERYCLYAADAKGALWRGEIQHAPWPLQPAEAEFEHNTMAAAHGLELPDAEPHLLYADTLPVVVWPLERVDTYARGADVRAQGA